MSTVCLLLASFTPMPVVWQWCQYSVHAEVMVVGEVEVGVSQYFFDTSKVVCEALHVLLPSFTLMLVVSQ